MSASALFNILLEYDYSNPGQGPSSQKVSDFGQISITPPGFVTLSDNIGNNVGVQGLLYVPSFPANSTCSNVTSPYLPANVTRVANIPSQNDFDRIAFAPWTTRECVFSYLQIANSDGAKAFYTFKPSQSGSGQSSDPSSPLNATDPTWDLGDGGAWKSQYQFPVYALSSWNAQALSELLSEYSGNITSTPIGQSYSQRYNLNPSNANIRMYSQVQLPNTPSLPSLWVFLLIVLGILIGVLVISSGIMRVIQRRRRRELQRMIANGEVDLQALGVARVKVTEEILGNMPQCIYVEHGGTPGPAHEPPAVPIGTEAANNTLEEKSKVWGVFRRNKPAASAVTRTRIHGKLEEKTVLFPQDSCVICLDEYENHSTAVRWLPCSHVFHPACIDPLLMEYSSLCPICKASVLPKGHIPEVTNLMVRRERLNRRFRDIERRERDRANADPNMPVHFNGLGRFVRVNNHQNTTQTPTSPRQPTSGEAADVEMQRLEPVAAPQDGSARQREASAHSAVGGARRPENVTREDWARQRAAALVGTSVTVEEAERQEEARRPLWRRVLGPAFPTLR